jgi:hypothetical protein
VHFNCVKTARKTELNDLLHSTVFWSGLSVFLVCSVCFLVRVTMVDKNKAVVSCLLATSVIMLSERKKRKLKMWSKKWCLERNISCDADLMMPSWCRMVNWGNCGIPGVNYAVLCVKDNWKGQFWCLRYCLSKQRGLLIFPSGMTLHSNTVQFNWECIECLRFIASVRRSFRMEIGSNRADFHEIWYFSIFRKSFEQIRVLLNLTRITVTLL